MVVSEFYNIPDHDLMGKGRRKEVVKSRQVAMYLLREELNSSYPSIGMFFGGRDHTTALHACEKITKAVNADTKLREELSLLRERLYSVA